VGLQFVKGLLEVLFLHVCAFQSCQDRFQCLRDEQGFPGNTIKSFVFWQVGHGYSSEK
jgi:hypothetical protein